MMSCPSGGRCAVASPARHATTIPTMNHMDTDRRIVVPPSERSSSTREKISARVLVLPMAQVAERESSAVAGSGRGADAGGSRLQRLVRRSWTR
jgi:hypothetical protein